MSAEARGCAADHRARAARSAPRALRGVGLVALSLALGTGAAGCEAATNAYCDVFSQSQMCCARLPDHHWDASTRRCEWTPVLPSS